MKSRKLVYLILVCVSASIVLIAFNFSQFTKYQISRRNNERKSEIANLTKGLANYIRSNSNLPTTSNPAEKSFLPELILLDGTRPSGGVSIQTLENVSDHMDSNMKDPSGNPYFIGTYEDKVLIYTNNFETENRGTDVYFESLDLPTTTKVE